MRIQRLRLPLTGTIAADGVITLTRLKEKTRSIAANAKAPTVGALPKRDANRYKDRNVVERFFSRATQWRGRATRCDKNAINYRAGMVLCAVFDRLKPNEETRPSPSPVTTAA